MASNGNGNGNGVHPPEEPDDEPTLPGWVPGPGFQRRARPEPPAGARRRRLRRRLFVAAGASTAVAFAVAFSTSVPTVASTIDDEAYVESASAICEPVERRLDEGDDEPDLAADASDDDRAAVIDARVEVLDGMVGRLDDLEPVAGAEDEVGRWLEDWRAVLASGRATADARRAGDDEAAAAASRAGQEPARRVNRFAVANGIRSCPGALATAQG